MNQAVEKTHSKPSEKVSKSKEWPLVLSLFLAIVSLATGILGLFFSFGTPLGLLAIFFGVVSLLLKRKENHTALIGISAGCLAIIVDVVLTILSS